MVFQVYRVFRVSQDLVFQVSGLGFSGYGFGFFRLWILVIQVFRVSGSGFSGYGSGGSGFSVMDRVNRVNQVFQVSGSGFSG